MIRALLLAAESPRVAALLDSVCSAGTAHARFLLTATLVVPTALLADSCQTQQSRSRQPVSAENRALGLSLHIVDHFERTGRQAASLLPTLQSMHVRRS